MVGPFFRLRIRRLPQKNSSKKDSEKSTASAKKAEPKKKKSSAKKTADKKSGFKPETKTITLPGGATMDLVWVEPGTFQMGSPETEEGRCEDEVQHEVILTKGYWIGKTAVTQRQWVSVMGENPSEFKGDNLPVANVSWDDCQEFFRKVNAANPEIRLRFPTEAEWEFAARGGRMSKRTVYSGSNNPDEVAWYLPNGGFMFFDAELVPDFDRLSNPPTEAVGTKAPNELGLYDMSGNVFEWCGDWYGPHPFGPVTDPAGPESGTERVCRGGCRSLDSCFCRVAARSHEAPRFGRDEMGFRVVCS